MHPKVLSARAWRTVKIAGQLGLLDGWTLAGGTGLALQFGHRYSEDLDLFNPEAFDPGLFLSDLSKIGAVHVQDRSASTLHAMVEGVRFSFLQCQPPLLFKGTAYRGLNVADPRDIAVMKIVAIGGWGSRKDFIDLYFYIQSTGSLGSVFKLLKKRFKKIEYNEYHLLKSLVYFEDAEREPMPEMIKRIKWPEVKKALIEEARRLGP
jgi:hypothetical protein